MKRDSLAVRLFATAAIWTAVVLPLAGLLIYSIYRSEGRSDFDGRLKTFLYIVLADSTARGGVAPDAPTKLGEALFEINDSGWYWQIRPIEAGGGPVLVSGSLATGRIKDPGIEAVDSDPEGIRWWDGAAPNGQPIRIAELRHRLGADDGGPVYSFLIAGPLNWVYARESSFRALLATALALAGAALLVMTYLQIRFGLAPLGRIERGLAAIRSGEAERLDGNLPSEIVPLQVELNALIRSNQEVIERARTQVGNLAHGLKTPLAVITNEADEASGPLGQKIAEQAEIMRRQISHYLDRARVAARTNTIGRVTDVTGVLEPLIRALERIYRDKNVKLELKMVDALRFQGEKQDLEEMLGNLMDNACKWSNGRVLVSVEKGSERSPGLLISIEDDGDGLTDDEMLRIVKRGYRLDETKPGSGLGLSIVSDLASLYHGHFRMKRSELGGLRAELELPAA